MLSSQHPVVGTERNKQHDGQERVEDEQQDGQVQEENEQSRIVVAPIPDGELLRLRGEFRASIFDSVRGDDATRRYK